MTSGRDHRLAIIIPVVLVLLFCAYAALRWNSEYAAFRHARDITDTRAYLRIASEPILSLNFLADNRPPIYPAVLKIFRGDFYSTVVFQTAFSIVAWGLLALAVARTFHLALRPLPFGLILLISLTRHVAGWDLVILTESLSLSFMALFLAAWFWSLGSWSWYRVLAVSLTAFLWVFTRDTNAWVLLMIAAAIALAVLFYGVSKKYAWISAIFVILFGLSTWNADIGNRWIYPFQNVLAQRILPNQADVEFFSACGMPVTPELMSLAGGYANSRSRAFYIDPALESYREWLHSDGKGCYVRWLLSSPLKSIARPWPDLGVLIAFRDVDRFFPQQYDPLLPWYLERLLYPAEAISVSFLLCTLAAVAALAGKMWKYNRAWIPVIVLCLLVYPHMFIVWHGDTVGSDRHAIMASIQFVLGLWLMALLILERVPYRLGGLLSRQYPEPGG